MAIPKKGSRKIIVDDIEYIYRVSKPKKKSDWREEENELNENFLNYAQHYGLGQVMDVNFGIVIQLSKKPVSNIFVKYHSIVIDGFLGIEQITQIKPNLIAHLIKTALLDGWNPSEKGDYRLTLAEQNTKDKEPIVLQLPDMNNSITDYTNIDRPVKIELNRNSGDERDLK